MSDARIFRKGDNVRIGFQGVSYPGVVILASGNGKSLALEFEAIIDGHVGLMPVLVENGKFYTLLTGSEITLTGA